MAATSFCSCSSDRRRYRVRRYKVVNLVMAPTWDILRSKATVPRWNSSVSFLTGTLRFEDIGKGEEGLPCQGVPIYPIFLCQLSRFCFPFPCSVLPSTSFCFHNSHILHHFFPFPFLFLLFLFVLFPSLSIPVSSFLLSSISILNFSPHQESDFMSLFWQESGFWRGKGNICMSH